MLTSYKIERGYYRVQTRDESYSIVRVKKTWRLFLGGGFIYRFNSGMFQRAYKGTYIKSGKTKKELLAYINMREGEKGLGKNG